jgi:TRAP-type C4-dicarboxylate transport system permease small subunit
MQALRRLAGGVYLLTQIVGSVGLIGLMITVGGTVIYRWFGGTFQGSYEVAETFTIVTITLAIFMATVNRSHVDVVLIDQMLPRRVRRGIGVTLGIVAVIFWFVVAYSVYHHALRLSMIGEHTDVLDINIVPFRWFTVLGFFAVACVLTWQTLHYLVTGIEPQSGHDPADAYDDQEHDT